jgi:two-component system chemotaxis response regulator CheB
MPERDIVVIGASAGGLAAFRTIVSALPAALPAALCVVQHLPASGPSLLPELLSAVSPLAARQPGDGEAIRHGQIYVAPPDHHLVIQPGHLHLVRGPKENGFRPAIDATLRSAARAYGPRVIGVILTGMLDDGTAGLLAVKRHRGLAIVQEPREAAYPSMPESARRYVEVDVVCPVGEIADWLIRLIAAGAPSEEEIVMDERTEIEAGISALDRAALQRADQLGTPSPFSCPDCGGVLAEYYDGELLRFRCQVGHAFSPASFFAHQTDELDGSLWAAFRALDERANLASRLAEEARRLNDSTGEQRFARLRAQAEQQKEQLRQTVLAGNGGEAPAPPRHRPDLAE